ncbi:MAG: hypothetical protein M3Y59_13715 [Myxococcota bacterium]|nr:hypothetical protein [Myxococcota bacterium]
MQRGWRVAVLAGAGLLGVAVARYARSGTGQPPSRVQIAAVPRLRQAAERTRARLEQETLRSTSRHSLQGDYEVLTESTFAPGAIHLRLETVENGRESTFIDLTEWDRTWEVGWPRLESSTYRLHEAPVEPPELYAYLQRGRLRLFDAEEPEVGALQRVETGVALFREAPPPEHLRAVEQRLTDSHFRVRERAVERLAQLRDGLEHRFDTEHGWLLYQRGPGVELTFEVGWGPSPPDSGKPIFSATPAPAPAPAPPAATRDLYPLLLSRCWGSDHRQPCADDAVLLPLEGARTPRRLPSAGAATPVAYLPDGKRVVILRDNPRGRRAYLLELENGRSHPLGGKTLQWGYTVSAALAPDGARLVLGHQVVDAEAQTQHYLTAMEGEASPLGAPVAAGAPEWLRDGSAVLLSTPGNKILRLALDGTTTELTSGTEPVAVNERLLLLRRNGRLHTFQLDTGATRRVGDGFVDAGRPAVSPDGRELLFVRQSGFTFVAERVALTAPAQTQRFALPPGRYRRPIWR